MAKPRKQTWTQEGVLCHYCKKVAGNSTVRACVRDEETGEWLAGVGWVICGWNCEVAPQEDIFERRPANEIVIAMSRDEQYALAGSGAL